MWFQHPDAFTLVQFCFCKCMIEHIQTQMYKHKPDFKKFAICV